MSSKLCQSGLDDAERDRAATVDVAVEGTQASPYNAYTLDEACVFRHKTI